MVNSNIWIGYLMLILVVSSTFFWVALHEEDEFDCPAPSYILGEL